MGETKGSPVQGHSKLVESPRMLLGYKLRKVRSRSFDFKNDNDSFIEQITFIQNQPTDLAD